MAASNSAARVQSVPPDIILPAQMWRRRHSPEHRLMIAVLRDAINCLLKDQGNGRTSREAQQWIMGPDVDWPFSFENVCDVLGLDPGCLRSGLRRWLDHPPTDEPKLHRRGQ